MLRIASWESLPGVGAAIGGIANLIFVRQALVDSQRGFQDRWLQQKRLGETHAA